MATDPLSIDEKLALRWPCACHVDPTAQECENCWHRQRVKQLIVELLGPLVRISRFTVDHTKECNAARDDDDGCSCSLDDEADAAELVLAFARTHAEPVT